MICKVDLKNLPKLFQRHCKEQRAQREDNSPISRVQIYTCRTRRQTPHTPKTKRKNKCRSSSHTRKCGNLSGVASRKGWTRGAAGSGWKAFTPLTSSVFMSKVAYWSSPMLALSRKNSLIKIPKPFLHCQLHNGPDRQQPNTKNL